MACIANFSAVPHLDYRVGLPRRAAGARCSTPTRRSTAAAASGNLGGIEAVAEPWHGQPASATITVPPLGVLWLSPDGPGPLE